MEAILKDLEQLAGVEHGCIYHQGQIKASTFPSVLNANLATMGRVLDQTFNGVTSIGKAHNEIYFELDDNYLVAYRTDQGYIILLLTGKRINFSLIHVSVQSAAKELKSSTGAPTGAPGQATHAVPPAAPESPASASLDSLQPKLRAVQVALTHHLGPVAQIVFEERLSQWRQAHPPTAANIVHLVRMLSEEISDERERTMFIRAVSD